MNDKQQISVSIFQSQSPDQCTEYALVLLAMGIGCRLMRRGHECHLEVDAADARHAREQLRFYVQENRARPQGFNPPPRVLDGFASAALFVIALLIFNILQRDQLFSIDWLQTGVSHAAAVRDGEWWRAFTALNLHTDTAHLFSNLFFGAVFIFLAGELLGWGFALSGVVFGGALGNLINAWVQSPAHQSIGASTSVFAAVGLLAAYNWSLKTRRLKRWVPLGAGVAVLAFMGMGGERTDVFAHVTGLGAGALIGFAFGAFDARRFLAERHKRLLGIVAGLFLVLAWAMALRA